MSYRRKDYGTPLLKNSYHIDAVVPCGASLVGFFHYLSLYFSRKNNADNTHSVPSYIGCGTSGLGVSRKATTANTHIVSQTDLMVQISMSTR